MSQFKVLIKKNLLYTFRNPLNAFLQLAVSPFLILAICWSVKKLGKPQEKTSYYDRSIILDYSTPVYENVSFYNRNLGFICNFKDIDLTICEDLRKLLVKKDNGIVYIYYFNIF